MTQFATVEDVMRGRRPPTEAEKADIESMIAAAGLWIRDRKPGIANDDQAANFVIIQVVRTALDTEKYRGLISFTKTTGGVSRSGTLAKPGELLVFTDFHHQLLGISATGTPSWHFGD
ncbi:hypothetical protein ACIGKR_29855 [Rhodococcus qingshengii]|uniref:hypothetical protein n=1 Tax=Rhodococcus qingshengii TaxID=334542 RepID=UPI0037CB7435